MRRTWAEWLALTDKQKREREALLGYEWPDGNR
jgi:hypothetical protein